MSSAGRTWKRTRTQAPGKDKVWQAMRIMRVFTAAELSTVTEVFLDSVERYLVALRKAGFVRISVKHVPGQKGSADRYVLVRNTGPLSPIQHNRGGVTDRNTGISWGDDGQPVSDAEDCTE